MLTRMFKLMKEDRSREPSVIYDGAFEVYSSISHCAKARPMYSGCQVVLRKVCI